MNSKPSCCGLKSTWASTAHMLKALGHPVRLEMVHRLLQKGCCCCGDLCNCFSHSQSTISQHLAVLADAGIVERKLEGNRSVYSLNAKAMQQIEQEIAVFANPDHAGATGD